MKSSELLLRLALRPRHDRRRARLFLSSWSHLWRHNPRGGQPHAGRSGHLRCCACASVWSVAKPGEAFG